MKLRLAATLSGAALLLLAATTTGCSAIRLGIANSADRLDWRVRRTADVPYGPEARQRLDVYAPSHRGATPAPVVVFVHGGRWSSGSKELYRFVATGLAERGFVVVVPNYRLYPTVRFQAALDDVAHAVAWTQNSALDYGADPARVVVAGHSAGSQLAAMLAFDPSRLRRVGGHAVQGFVGFSGPYDFLPLTDADLIDYFGPPERFPESQPICYVDSSAPPAFLVHGLADTTVKPRNTRALAARLDAVGVPVESHFTADEDHAGTLRRFARFYRGEDPLYADLVRFISAVPMRTRSPDAMPAASSKPEGANTMIVEPCSNHPSSAPRS